MVRVALRGRLCARCNNSSRFAIVTLGSSGVVVAELSWSTVEEATGGNDSTAAVDASASASASADADALPKLPPPRLSMAVLRAAAAAATRVMESTATAPIAWAWCMFPRLTS